MRKAVLILSFCVPLLTARADEQLPELPVGNDVYHNVTVTWVTATDVFFTSAEGLANAKLRDLDPIWQDHFHYHPATAGGADRRAATGRVFIAHTANQTQAPSSLANIPGARAGANSSVPQEYLQRNYDVHLTIETGNGVSGDLRLGAVTNDTGQVNDYLWALANECKKYPPGFLGRAGVSEIVLCGSLEMGKAPIAGLFVQQQKKVYLMFHWCRFGAHCRETFHAFHHELGHALQSATWGDGHYDWREWANLNPSGFSYGNGGTQDLMADPERNWGSWSTNRPGFLNAYSATAPWEDRSEIMAALLNDGDRAYLRSYYHRDPVIQKKIEMMSALLSKFCGPSQAKYFWEQAVTALKTQPEPSLAANPAPPAGGPVDLQKGIGGDVIDADGNAVPFATLTGKKYFLLYFSASWCPHCREFMPQFVEFYRSTQYHDKMEVLFVSSDHSEKEMLRYLREMPWKAVRFNSDAEAFLKANYSRGPGIPGLALVDSDGRLIGIRKGFAKNFDNGVDKMLDVLNQKLAGDN